MDHYKRKENKLKEDEGKSQDEKEDDEKASNTAEESEAKKIDESEKMKNIPKSRTLLAKISCQGITIEVSGDPVQ